ncbi:transporter [Legionella brunensis]|uniref:Uncharacterized protein n=1 Tax=Legionella brunensis TaxID=29422 RepID=A0A0W0SDE9_9GAMM|nr:transporter [Legionella brunensis]KTC81394.1 hypothetical protein Lbru_1914 [Legionella brunensis]
MLVKQGRNLFYVLIILSVNLANVIAQTYDNPCTGSPQVLVLTDRGGNVDSPCSLPLKTAFLEGGYQYQTLKPSGWQQTFPQGEFRIGLPGHNEIGLFLSNYNRINEAPFSGYSPFSFDFKHPFSYGQNWIFTGSGTVIFPGGSSAFGSESLGIAISGIGIYAFNEQWSATAMLEGGSFTNPTLEGGGRYTSLLPDVLISYAPIEKISLYAEIYGQSQTGPHESGAVIVDCGFIYMLKSMMALDFGVYQQLTNNPNQYNNSVIAGITLVL